MLLICSFLWTELWKKSSWWKVISIRQAGSGVLHLSATGLLTSNFKDHAIWMLIYLLTYVEPELRISVCVCVCVFIQSLFLITLTLFSKLAAINKPWINISVLWKNVSALFYYCPKIVLKVYFLRQSYPHENIFIQFDKLPLQTRLQQFMLPLLQGSQCLSATCSPICGVTPFFFLSHKKETISFKIAFISLLLGQNGSYLPCFVNC